ncbi:MAG: SNF2 helicase associated domain-containing protein, partial [Chitinispirillaceae bacterium]|nr:SNF2 helicase associated domain-containing protein [Chitinispirillaceae bacterium]
MTCFTEAEIREHSFSAVFEEGRRLFASDMVRNLHCIGDDIVATVTEHLPYRVAISRIGKKLQFSCTCGAEYAGACAHAVAAMLAANGHAAIQVGIDWNFGNNATDNSGSSPATGQIDEAQEVPEVDDDPDTSSVHVSDLPPEKPVIRLYLSESEGMLLAELRFAYHNGTVEFSRADSVSCRLVAAKDGNVYRIHRSRARETAAASILSSFDLISYQVGFYTPSIDPRDWTLQQLPQLSSEGFEIYGQERLQSTQARKSKPVLRVSVASAGDTFNCSVQVSIDGVPATLAALIIAIRQKSRFILLTDGSSGTIPEAWIEMFASL